MNIEFSALDKCEGDNTEGFDITLDRVDIPGAFGLVERLIGRLGYDWLRVETMNKMYWA